MASRAFPTSSTTTPLRPAAPPNLTTLFNNTLFYTWRPRPHLLPPFAHIGDPCIQYTDPSTGLFHAGYLYSGGGGLAGAASATTADLITYHDLSEDPTFIRGGGINDPLFVFDGTVIPAGINGSATLLYTSVSYLPIQWTVPYVKGSETQSLALSSDGGKNFTKLRYGPVIPISKFFTMTTTINFPSSARTSNLKAGFRILGSHFEHTDIYYQFSNESIIIDRSDSSAAVSTTSGILTNNEAGRLRLFDISPPTSNSSSIEALNLTIVVDNSIVEVYANDRFALSTWVWSWLEESTQISFFYETADEVRYDNTTIYEGLFDAWPMRRY